MGRGSGISNVATEVATRGAVSLQSDTDLSTEELWEADLSGPEFDEFDEFESAEADFLNDSRNFRGQVI